MHVPIIDLNRLSGSMPLRLVSDHLVIASNGLHIECSRYNDDVEGV